MEQGDLCVSVPFHPCSVLHTKVKGKPRILSVILYDVHVNLFYYREVACKSPEIVKIKQNKKNKYFETQRIKVVS